MEVIIRPFRADDWDGVFFLDRACFEPPYRLEYPRLRALVQDATVAVIVVEARESSTQAGEASGPPEVPALGTAPAAAAPVSAESVSAGTVSGDSLSAAPAVAPEVPGDVPVPAPAEVPPAAMEAAVVAALLVKHDAAQERLVLLSVMVDPGFRRLGLGRRLMGWAERLARARTSGEMIAPLEAENETGAAFLTAQGFVRGPGERPFFEDPAGGDLWRRAVPPLRTRETQASAEPAPAPPAQAPDRAADAPPLDTPPLDASPLETPPPDKAP